ncbi:hypothetical protein WG66_005312 [Moniliophthora roreri]|uniref:DUF6534 domain-containing protein n=1 Tax=Moniliophthora roreri TaxID=221103 RepID=A0A0W0FG77_MONRR|nr:hypothetical protein WG66_005312 [Moniliophthora roreri]
MSSNQPALLAAPLFLGYMLNWGLYGVLSVQVYLYWTAFPHDGLVAQTLVYGLYLLETAQTVSLTHNAFQGFVFGFENFVALTKIHNLWLDTYVLDGLGMLLPKAMNSAVLILFQTVAFVFQIYFANRIRNLLPRSYILVPGIIALLSLAQLAGSVGAAVIIKHYAIFSAYAEVTASPVPGYLWIVCGTLADILITVTMVYALSRYDTTFKQTRGLVRRLSRLAIETGGLIAAMSLVQPVLSSVFPDQTYHIAPAIVIAKLYSNSLLATLNSRIKIHGARGTTNNANVTPDQNPNGNQPIPIAGLTSDSSGTSSWVPSTFPSRLDWDMDSNGLMNTLDSKADTNGIAGEPQIASLGSESKGEYHLSSQA